MPPSTSATCRDVRSLPGEIDRSSQRSTAQAIANATVAKHSHGNQTKGSEPPTVSPRAIGFPAPGKRDDEASATGRDDDPANDASQEASLRSATAPACKVN